MLTNEELQHMRSYGTTLEESAAEEIIELREAYALLFKENFRLRNALEVAVRQNEHDMLMTGEEMRDCRAALGPNVRGNLEPTA